jgi:hypothetical protein
MPWREMPSHLEAKGPPQRGSFRKLVCCCEQDIECIELILLSGIQLVNLAHPGLLTHIYISQEIVGQWEKQRARINVSAL